MGSLKTFRCGHCNKKIVVMDTTNNSVIPVEVPEGIIFKDDEVFDGRIHASHLKNCQKLQSEWTQKKMKFIRQRNALAAFAPVTLKERTR